MEQTLPLSIGKKSFSKERFGKLGSAIDRHEIFTMAGSLAYTTALALAPFVLIILSLASLLPPDIQREIYAQLSVSFGDKAGAAIKAIIEGADNNRQVSGASGIIGFLILAVSASAIFSQLKIALNKINEYEAPKSKSGFWLFMKDKFFSFGLVFGFAFLTIVSMMVTIAIAVFAPPSEDFLWQAVSFVISALLFAGLFSCIYRFVPSDTMPWKKCFIAGAVSTLFYLIGKSLIGLYLANAGLESAYGAAGSLVIFLAWVYYTGLMMLVSYEFSRVLIFSEEKTKRKPVPSET